MIPWRHMADDAERHPAGIIQEVAAEGRDGVLMGARQSAEIAKPFRQPA
jgi:hypothetical protein